MENSVIIKFQAWDGEKMYDVKNICFEGRPMITLQYNPACRKPLDNVKLLQYIGFKDKNNKEVFADYIIKYFIETGGISERVKGFAYGVVKYKVSKYVIEPFKYDESLSSVFGKDKIFGFLDSESFADVEIIGNIHEDKHLLE